MQASKLMLACDYINYVLAFANVLESLIGLVLFSKAIVMNEKWNCLYEFILSYSNFLTAFLNAGVLTFSG